MNPYSSSTCISHLRTPILCSEQVLAYERPVFIGVGLCCAVLCLLSLINTHTHTHTKHTHTHVYIP